MYQGSGCFWIGIDKGEIILLKFESMGEKPVERAIGKESTAVGLRIACLLHFGALKLPDKIWIC